MDEIDHLKKIVRDQTRMLQEKNRLLSEMECRLKQSIVSGSRKEDLAKFQFQLSRDTIEGQSSLLKTLLESLPSGLIVVDAKRRVISCNQTAQKILKTPDKNILGKPCSELLGAACEEDCLLNETIGKATLSCSREMKVRTGEGGEVTLSMKLAPIRNRHGALVGGVEIFSEANGTTSKERLFQEKHDSMIRVLARIIKKKDNYILSHSERVKKLALKLAENLGISNPEELQEMSLACLLHDIGMLSVPDKILNAKKTGSPEALERIRSHPVDGENMLNSVDDFSKITKAVRSHHERFDGEGYPDGLSGDKIPLASRIIGLVEAYDAMLHDEATEKRPEKVAREEIEVQSGSQFDPDLVNVFLTKVVGDAG